MQWIVHTAHTSNYPNPIRFQVGDPVQVGKRDEEFPGWIWVITSDGNQGWAPIQYLQIDGFDKTANALHAYSAWELNTTIGESLTLLYELNGWGWVENENKESGWVPLHTIERIVGSDR
ncbi:MAG: SH3 domain-containing protein [Anaerolineaceae bacterium]|nr:SH3 domain-containing protein [Anaerolineaceae bacterium]